MNGLTHFFSGVLSMAYLVSALFFLKFWRQSRDRLFALFATGFVLLAVQRILLPFVQPAEVLYAVRLAGFIVIAAAILDKNRQSTPPPAA